MASKLVNISEQIHATAVEIYGDAILLRGEPGSGKSDLALRLIHEGAKLISDDRVELTYKNRQLYAGSPGNINGIIEVRGVGLLEVGCTGPKPVQLVVDLALGLEIERLPEPQFDVLLRRKVRVIQIDPFSVSATAKIRYALKLVTGEVMSFEMNPSQITPETCSSETVVLVTGMSGAGKTTALKVFEDMDFEAIDNVPLSLLGNLVLGRQKPFNAPGLSRPIAVGVDIRTRDFGIEEFFTRYDTLVSAGEVEAKLVFLDCDDEELRRRYEETRHRHPLAADRPVADGIAHERRLVLALRDRADLVIDTTGMTTGEFKRLLQGNFTSPPDNSLSIFLTSFSYRRGVPRSSDLVFDVRFLSNPHYDESLRDQTGLEEAVGKYVSRDPSFMEFFDSLTHLIEPLLPRYRAEGKSYLTIAAGCTGGRHRSVFVIEKLALWFENTGQKVQVLHRELANSP